MTEKKYATWSLNKAAAAQRSRARSTRTENDQEVSDRFSTEGSIWIMNTSCTKEQNLGPTAGATAVVSILPSSSLVPLFLLVSWLLPLASGLPVVFVFCPWCCSESEHSVNNSRIQHSNCLWFTLTFSPFVLEFTSGTVALHSVF